MDLYGTVSYCLACHRILREEDRSKCRFCDADQEQTRQELMARAEAWEKAPRLKRGPPLPLNAFQDVSCPTCHVVVKAGAGRCPFCLHYMLPPAKSYVPDDRIAYRYALVSVAATTLQVLMLGRGALFPAYFFGFVGIATAFATHGEMPDSRLGLGLAALSGVAMVFLVAFSMAGAF